jgi:hypothetical protein
LFFLLLSVQQHVLIVADVRKQPDTHTMLECGTKLSLPHPGSITDLQVTITCLVAEPLRNAAKEYALDVMGAGSISTQ